MAVQLGRPAPRPDGPDRPSRTEGPEGPEAFGDAVGSDPVERPASVRWAVVLVGVFVAIAFVATCLGVWFHDELVDAWAGGSGLSPDDTRVPPSFTPVIVTLFVVVTILAAIFCALMLGGNNWARFCLAAMGVLVAVAIAGGLREGPPPLFVGCSVLILLVDLALEVCLLHPGTTAYLRLPEQRRGR